MPFAVVKQKQDRVLVTFRGSPQSDEDCASYLRQIDVIYGRRQPFYILYDAREVGLVSQRHITLQANFMRRKESETKKLMICAAVVVHSPVARGMLSTLFKIKPPAAPCRIFNTLIEAQAFLRLQRKRNTRMSQKTKSKR